MWIPPLGFTCLFLCPAKCSSNIQLSPWGRTCGWSSSYSTCQVTRWLMLGRNLKKHSHVHTNWNKTCKYNIIVTGFVPRLRVMTLWKISVVDTQFKQLWKRSLKKKNSGFSGIRTRDICDTGAVLYQLSYEAITVGSRSILVGPSCH